MSEDELGSAERLRRLHRNYKHGRRAYVATIRMTLRTRPLDRVTSRDCSGKPSRSTGIRLHSPNPACPIRTFERVKENRRDRRAVIIVVGAQLPGAAICVALAMQRDIISRGRSRAPARNDTVTIAEDFTAPEKTNGLEAPLLASLSRTDPYRVLARRETVSRVPGIRR